MVEKILTTHVGSLPRTPELIEAGKRLSSGEMTQAEFGEVLQEAVADVVARQEAIGIDIVNDGEYGHIMTEEVDYGAWWHYSFARLGGLSQSVSANWMEDKTEYVSEPKLRLTSFQNRRDWRRFEDAYFNPTTGILNELAPRPNPEITGPVTYTGASAARKDVDLLTTAVGAAEGKTGFVAALSPGAAARLTNRYYENEVDQLNAFADAMAEEYRIITEAGHIVQLDAPDMAEAWDQMNPEPSVADFQEWLQLRVDAANRALEGIDPDLVRLHICWGSWHGPHTTDIPLADIVDQILQVNASQLSFEASSPRHAHEWKVWKGGRLPGGKKIVPGVVCHSTNIVEHPELVAERIVRFAEVVGPENVIASTDCGLGGRIHPDIAWAKLESLTEGAQIASKQIFG